MGIFSRKDEAPAEQEARAEAQDEPRAAPAPNEGRARLRRIVLGAAVLLTAVVLAAPFFVSDRAIEAEHVAKVSIPPVPAASPQGSAAPAASPSAAAAAPAASPAPAAVVPAAPGGSAPMPAPAAEPPKAPAAAPAAASPKPQAMSAEEAARLRAKEDAAAKARAKEIAARNAKAKAEIDKAAKAQKKAADDELAAAIQARSAKEAAKKDSAAEAKKAADAKAAGRWVLPVGSFSSPEAAQKVVANARANGVSLSVSTVKTSKGTLSRVSAGPFSSKAEAETAEARLAMAGIRTGALRQVK